jgi:hypothetical protein
MLALKQEQLFEEIDILPIDSLWIKEVNQRKNEIENNQVSLIDGDEVFKKIS